MTIYVEVTVAVGQGTREKLIHKTTVVPSAIVWHPEDSALALMES